jgi:hypothetical protein
MALDLDRLPKIWKLATSHNAGDAAKARNRTRAAIVERESKALADIPGLLRALEKAAKFNRPDMFA